MEIHPYLIFEGRCEEALAFYHDAVGAKTTQLMRFKDNPEADGPCSGSPEHQDKIMHASLDISGATVMASDGMCSGKPAFQGVSLVLTAPDGAAAERMFAALGEGGQVTMPLGKTFFASHFGMVADKFGVHWMVIVPNPVR